MTYESVAGESKSSIAPEVDLDSPRRVAAARRLVPSVHDDTLDRLSALAARLLGAPSAQVALVTDVQTVVGGVGVGAAALETGRQSREDSLCIRTVRGNLPLRVADTTRDPRVAHLPPATAGVVGAYLGVPITSGDGYVVGALCVYEPTSREWRDEHVMILQELATAFAAELERGAANVERDSLSLRFGIAAETARVGSWESDLSTDRTLVDELALDIFGLADSPYASTVLDGHVAMPTPELIALVGDEERPRALKAVCAAIRDRQEFLGEHRLSLLTGEVRWVAVRGRPQYDEQGRCSRVVGAVYDTTARHTIEEQAETASRLLELMSRAGVELTDSLEIKDAVQSLSRIVVPALADWSVATLIDEQGHITLFECWHRDPACLEATEQLARARLQELDTIDGLDAVLRDGKRLIVPSGASSRTITQTRSEVAVTMARQLRHDSGALLPLMSGDQVVGLLILARTLDRPAMTELELDAADELARRASRAITNAQSFTRQRDMAAALQRSMLTDPVQPDQMEVAVRYVPAAAAVQVGGDWYDAFMQRDGRTIVVAGDVVGHDTASAAAMGQLRSILRGIGVASGDGPAALLRSVDEALALLQVDTYATVLVARIEPEPVEGLRGARLRWSNAGHPPPVLLHADGTTQRLRGNDLMLGVDADSERSEHVVTVGRGTTIVLYTDGLVERRGEDIDVGIKRLRKALRASRDMNLEACVDHMLAAMLSDEPVDDVVVLAVRLKPQAPAAL